MAGLNQTPSSERVHIAFFGRRNAGKSSLVNEILHKKLATELNGAKKKAGKQSLKKKQPKRQKRGILNQFLRTMPTLRALNLRLFLTFLKFLSFCALSL